MIFFLLNMIDIMLRITLLLYFVYKVHILTFIFCCVVVMLNNLSLIWEQYLIYSHVMKLQVKTDIVWISAYLEFGNNTQSVKYYRSYTLAHLIFESAKCMCVCMRVCVYVKVCVLMYPFYDVPLNFCFSPTA